MASEPKKRGDKTTNAKTWSCSNSRNNGCVIKAVKAEPNRNQRGRCANCGSGWINEDPVYVYGSRDIQSVFRPGHNTAIISGESFGKVKVNLRFNRHGEPVLSKYGQHLGVGRDHETEDLIHAWIPMRKQVFLESDLIY